MKRISRRTFLKLAGVSATAAAVYESTGSILAALSIIDRTTPEGEEALIPSVCQLCPAECGLRVRVVGGLAVKIGGNHQNPNNKGRTCPKGQAALQLLYSPDRVRAPLRRVGERGEGAWEEISWDEAIAAVAAQLSALRSARTAERMAFLYDRPVGLLGEAIARFCSAMGTPNAIDVRPDALSKALLLTQGHSAPPAYDLEKTRYLLSFNFPLLESAQPTVRMLSAYSFMRRGRLGDRSYIVQIEPRQSVTAIKADEWVPVVPGTEGLLALGMAWVIIDEHLYDRAFVAQHCYGFEEWSQAILAEYDPSSVSAVTGVPAGLIARLAREFAGHRPSLAVGGEQVEQHTNGLFNQMAIHSLNALVGSIDVPGGSLVQLSPPLAPWPEVELDGAASAGLEQPRLDGSDGHPLGSSAIYQLPETILRGEPYSLDALLLYRANPLHDAPDPEMWRHTLERIPFIVSFDPFIEETSAHADYILPNHTFLERWIAAPLMPSLGYPALALGQPTVSPLYETRGLGDVLIQLASRIGGTVEDSFAWDSYVDMIRERASGLMSAGDGSIRTDTEEDFWDQITQRGVWIGAQYAYASEENGAGWESVLSTPSGRFEFKPQLLEQDTSLTLPYYEPPVYVGDEEEYPFYLQLYTLMAQARGPGAANLPHLHELYGLHVKHRWGNWVEINPETAHELGIEDREEVWVESAAGRIRLPARTYAGVHPEIVCIPDGLGHTVGGQWSVGIGSNAEALIKGDHVDSRSALVARQGMRVKVYKVEG